MLWSPVVNLSSRVASTAATNTSNETTTQAQVTDYLIEMQVFEVLAPIRQAL